MEVHQCQHPQIERHFHAAKYSVFTTWEVDSID